jgi:GNAT superfamily N-acetyltransferase
MGIRQGTLTDAAAIQGLLKQLNYPIAISTLERKIELVLANPRQQLVVYELDGTVVAFLILDFLIQLGLGGDIARIGYFAVDQHARSKGVGAEMEAYLEKIAEEKQTDRIEVHCHERRKDAQRFYFRQ